MKKIMGMLLLVLMCDSASYATSFKLQHGKLGPTYGPFEFKDGETIEIGEWIMTLVVVDSSDGPSSEQQLSEIILPQVDFTNEPIDTCFEKLNTMIHTQSPKAGHINIVLGAALQQQDKESIYSFREYPMININLQNTSALDAIQAICQQANLIYTLTETGVYIDKPTPTPTPKQPATETLSY